MKTHVTINGKEIRLIQQSIFYNMGDDVIERELNEEQVRLNVLLLALDGISFEKKEEQKPFSVDNPPKEGETYFHIISSPSLIITEECFVDDDYDEHCVSQNNCFRTKEEAESALSRVLQALKS